MSVRSDSRDEWIEAIRKGQSDLGFYLWWPVLGVSAGIVEIFIHANAVCAVDNAFKILAENEWARTSID